VAADARRLAVLAAALALLGAAAACSDDHPETGAPPATSAAATTAAATGPTACDHTPPSPAPDPQTYAAPPRREIDPERSYTATLDTSCGEIVIALDAARAPVAVNNFVALARDGFYDGLTFHRVVEGFVIQGGDPEGDGTGGPGYTFEDELPTDGYPPGSVAMANAGPNTNGSQFFIVTGQAPLPNAFTRFGRVTRGLDVARRIEGFADPGADPGDPEAQRPTEPIYISEVTVAEGP
jgi:cyclophilin family peptidyl-prolyl cis-trans isomerase